jgi:hypothetical protein
VSKPPPILRNAATAALSRAYGEIIMASVWLLQGSFNLYRAPRSLSDEAGTLMLRRERRTREHEAEIDAALWETWHEACGLHLLGEKRNFYRGLAQNTNRDWLPFTESTVRAAKLTEIFEHSGYVLFGQLPRDVADFNSMQPFPATFLLPKAPNVRCLGSSDWRREWLIEFVRTVHVLHPDPVLIPHAVVERLQESSLSADASIKCDALQVTRTRKAELRVRILDAEVLGEFNRIVAKQALQLTGKSQLSRQLAAEPFAADHEPKP